MIESQIKFALKRLQLSLNGITEAIVLTLTR